MSLYHKRAYSALAASVVVLAIAACSDNSVTEASPLYFTTTSKFEFRNPKTNSLELLVRPQGSDVRASVYGSSSSPALLVSTNAPGLGRVLPNGGERQVTYVDSLNRTNRQVFFYRPQGGPVASSYHFVNGKLYSTTAFTWAPIAGGWYESSQITRIFTANGALANSYTISGQYTTTTRTCSKTVTTNCVPAQTVRFVSPARRVIGYLALGLANACLPSLANAQTQGGFYFAACFNEWKHYMFMMAIVYGTAGGVEMGPAEWVIAAAAVEEAASALQDLVRCMDQASSQVSENGMGGGGGGAGGGAGGWDCFDGTSLSAHCTTAFTL